MLHLIVLKIIHLGWLSVPFPLYALYSRHFLDQKEAQLLIIQAVMLLSLMLPGWVMLIFRLVGTGFFVLIVLDLCLSEYQEFISRYEIESDNALHNRRTKKYRQVNGSQLFMIKYERTLKKFKLKQTFLWPILVLLWICIRSKFTKVLQFGKGQVLFDGRIFEGFINSLDGWNCNYAEFTIISALWLSVLVFCWWFLHHMLNCAHNDTQVSSESFIDLNGYKIYLLKFLLLPAFSVLCIDIGFNLVAHLSCEGPLECYKFFKYGIVIVLIINWGIPASIGLFFFKKIGRFYLQSEHDQSQASMDEGDIQQQQALIQSLNK